MTILTNAKPIMDRLKTTGFDAFIVGGAVRDMVLGVEPHDYDIFTNASGQDLIKLFPECKILGSPERQAKIYTVVVDGIEVSQYRANGDRTETGGTLLKHQSTCDFTINSMTLGDKRIIDPHGGKGDITNKIIKCVGLPERRIAEDKLRILRAIRFAYCYGFTIELNLMDVIKKTDLSGIAPERLHDELLKILTVAPDLDLFYQTGNKKHMDGAFALYFFFDK